MMSYQLRKETEESYVFENDNVLVDMDARGFGYLKDFTTMYHGCLLSIVNHEAYLRVEKESELIALNAIVNFKTKNTGDATYEIEYDDFLKKLFTLEGDNEYQISRDDPEHTSIETKYFKVTMGRLDFGNIVDRVNILGQATLRVFADKSFHIVGREEDDTLVGDGNVQFKGEPCDREFVFNDEDFMPRLLAVVCS